MNSNNVRTTFYQEKVKYKKFFKKNYVENVLQIFKDLENLRKRQLKKWLLTFTLSSTFLIATIISALNCNNFVQTIINWIIGISSFIGIIVSLFIYDVFIMDIKTECMQKLVSAFEDIKWKDKDIDINDMSASQLFPIFTDRTSDDYFNGIHNGVNFLIDELLLYGVGGVTAFKGLVILLNFNKAIFNKTIITDKSNVHTKTQNLGIYLSYTLFFLISFILGICTFSTREFEKIFLGIVVCVGGCIFFINKFYELIKKNKENKISDYENLYKVQLEDINFDKKYTAYSSDQVEGRYLITTAFMERFKNLQYVFGTSKIKCSFYSDKLMFAISTKKNFFEIGNLFTPLTDYKTVEKFFDEIIAIFVIIDYLKLNQKIGL